jgi:hypothetical protein
LQSLLLFLPILGAALLHAPVLRFDLLRVLKRPLDGGRTFRGARLFGDNKTWRGAVVMGTGVVLATVALSHVDAYWSRLPAPVQQAGPLWLGILLGLGCVLGELPNSFLKRQLGIGPGMRARSATGVLLSIYDQGDFVPVVWATVAPIWRMPAREVGLAFVVVVAAHMIVNAVGFAIGARKTWT